MAHVRENPADFAAVSRPPRCRFARRTCSALASDARLSPQLPHAARLLMRRTAAIVLREPIHIPPATDRCPALPARPL